MGLSLSREESISTLSSTMDTADDSLPVIVEVDEELNGELLGDHHGERTRWYFVGEGKYLFPSKYAAEASDIQNFECRDDDVWVVTFPRSGTTLTQELVWMVMNNFDYETGKEKSLWVRTPFFEMNLFVHEEVKQILIEENADNPQNQTVINDLGEPAYGHRLRDMESPRLIKTHFPICLLPKGVHEKKLKMIYVARNPKDVIPSYFYLLKLWRTSDYMGPFERFWKQFRDGHIPWGPFWPHVIEGWNHRDDENVLFLFYEDMMKDMQEAIMKVADFLSIPVTEEQVAGLVEHLNIRNFSKNQSVNCEDLRDVGVLYKEGESFVRTGDKRTRPKDMTPEILEEIEEWTEKYYETTDLRFPVYK